MAVGPWSNEPPRIDFSLLEGPSDQPVVARHPLVQVRLGQTVSEETGPGLAVSHLKVLELQSSQVLRVHTESDIFIGLDNDPNRGFIIEVDALNLPIPIGGGNLLDEGVTISRAAVHLPPDLPSAPESIIIEQATINSSGFTGSVSAVFDSQPSEDNFLFGLIPAQIYAIALEIRDNLPVAFAISGAIKLPDFDEWIEVELALNELFDIAVKIASADPDGIVLTKDEVLALTFRSAGFSYQQGLLTLSLSGGLQPLLMGSDGLEWPKLDVTDLTMEQDLNALVNGRFQPPVFKFREAWLDLNDLSTLDLWGFHFELNRIGMGYEADIDKLWLDLTGSLRLIELLPVGLGVEGFRITWPRLLYEEVFAEIAAVAGQPVSDIGIDDLDLDALLAIAAKIEVKFDGVYIFFGVPQSVEFEGYIRFIKEAQNIGFAGDVALRMPASGFAAEAGLMVGVNFAGDPLLPGIPLPYLYVYLGIELPSGIPLGQSGLAIKGALGLMGLNVAPDKTPEQNWYYDWYKREPFVGVHQTNKWRFQAWSVAFGAGITIVTTGKDIVGVRGLLALVLPGPIMVIEGQALILEGLLPIEPPLRALAVFDGPARTVQFNIETDAEVVEGIVEAYAMAEAFFDFKDLTNWHLHLGQDDPWDRRIRANFVRLLNNWLFDANAYLMLDMVEPYTLRARLGVFVGFEPPIPSLGPVDITINAVLEGVGEVTVLPEHFSGSVDLTATIGLSAFGFGILANANAGVATEGAGPVIVDGKVRVSAEFPSPTAPLETFVPLLPPAVQDLIPEIEPYTFETELHFHWESPEPPEVIAPLTLAAMESQFAPAEGSRELTLFDDDVPVNEAEASISAPTVALDPRPTLLFNQSMGQDEEVRFGRHPDGEAVPSYSGPIRFTSWLEQITLYRSPKGRPLNWAVAASSHPDTMGGEWLSGVWMADVDLGDATTPAVRRLRLWSDQPFLNPGMLNPVALFHQTGQSQSYIQQMLAAYPHYYDDRYSEAEEICIDFKDAPVGSIFRPGGGRFDVDTGWHHHALKLSNDPLAEIVALTTAKPVAKPQFDAIELWQALRTIDSRTFRTPSVLSDALLPRWARRISPVQQISIRRRFKALASVWSWLWPPTVTRTCLLLMSGDRNVARLCFGEPMWQVTLHLRAASRLPAAELLQRIRTRQENEVTVEHDLVLDKLSWQITARDAPFGCVEFTRVELLIESICTVTQAEQARAERAEAQAQVNETIFADDEEPMPVLDPGHYYKLKVQTRTDAVFDLANSESDPVTALIYGGIFSDHLPISNVNPLLGFQTGVDLQSTNQRTYFHTAYFQTDGPPHQLAPYIKWSSPQHQARRVFRADEFAVRFRRDYLAVLFPEQSAYALEARLVDGDGRVLTGHTTTWEKAATTTLLPEEQHWLEHVGQLPDYAPAPRPKDDLLRVRRDDGAPPLAPKARYQLLLTGGAGGELFYLDDFAETDPSLAMSLPTEWIRDGGAVRRTGGANGVPFTVGDGTWRDVDVAVEVKLPGPGARADLYVRDGRAPFKPGEEAVRQRYRISIAYNAAARRFELAVDYVVGQGDAAETWPIAVRPLAAATDDWVRLRVQALHSTLRVWHGEQSLVDVDLKQLRVIPPSQPDGPFLRPIGLRPIPIRRLPLPRILYQGTVALNSDSPQAAFRRFTVRDAILHRIPFMTSAYEWFGQMADSILMSSLPVADTASISVDETRLEVYARDRLGYERGLIDLRDDVPGCDRAHVEALKLALREAGAELDQVFRTAADTLVPGHVYQPVGDHLEVCRLENQISGQCAGIWIKSPESLDLRLRTGDGVHVGRTAIELRHNGAVVAFRLVALADSTQLLLLPGPGASWNGTGWTLTLTYHRDHGDEAHENDHRYDRPVAYPIEPPMLAHDRIQFELGTP